MSDNTFYLTAAIPYVNAKPHLGHVLEWFQADTIVRYHKLLGQDVFFTCGADENSLKNVQAAEKAGKEPQAWLDEYSKIFEDAFAEFGVEVDSFRRGSDKEKHWPGVQKLWELCKHDMYKKTYTGLYCLGCEQFYTQDELVDGKCPEHLTVPETVEEENWFFKLSKYQNQIEQLIVSDKLQIVSDQFKQEMLGFVRSGLKDFSVSRSNVRGRGIGVPVPDDSDQVMYVWFDALSIYLTGVGWGYDQALFEKYWPADVHVIGKGINRFHSVYWIGMLLSAGLPTPKSVSVHGYITANGQKMSKSLGNVIDPFELVKKYEIETIRYYLLKYIPTHADGDFSYEKFAEIYTADLANGLGNLCSRVAKLCEKSQLQFPPITLKFSDAYNKFMVASELDKAMEIVMELVAQLDKSLADSQPWKKEGEELREILEAAVEQICYIAFHLEPFMPKTAKQILNRFSQEKITAMEPLFPRLQ
ncbi:MAG: methionine--tRNA ligase [Patescibacteria group bacterium]